MLGKDMDTAFMAARWRDVTRDAQLIVGVIDMEGNVAYANPFMLKLTGWTEEELRGMHWYTFMPDAYKAQFSDFRDFTRENTVPIVEFPIRKKSGDWVNISWYNGLIHDEDGAIIGLLSIGKDVTEQRHADVAKTKLFSQAAHQLRTPITNMRWSLEVLKDETQSWQEEKRECLNDAYKSVLRMSETIETLLMASRIEAKSLHADSSVLILQGFLQEIYDEHRRKYGKQKQSCTIDCPPDCAVQTDPAILREIISTLVSNAIKYTPDDGAVSIAVTKTSKGISIGVTDTGIGIPRDELKKVFTKVYRGRKALASTAEGTGLGLYLAHSLVDVLGGEIAVASEENHGTTVTVTLPSLITEYRGQEALR